MWCTLDMTYGESWVRLSIVIIYQTTKLLYYMNHQPCEDIKLVPKSTRGFNLWWDLKVVIYPYELGHYWWKLVVIGILNKNTMISHEIETVWSPWVIQSTCDYEIYSHNNTFNGIWHMLLGVRVCQLII